MNNNMQYLLNQMYKDSGNIINNLIKCKIVTKREVIDCAINSKIPYLNYYVGLYLKRLSKKDICLLADSLIEIGNIKYICDFAKNVNGAPVERLADFVISNGTDENIFVFARDVKGAPIEKLVNAILFKDNSEYIYKFIVNVSNVPLDILIDRLISKMDSWYLCLCSNNLNDKVLKNKILDAILGFRNAKYIYEYANEVKDAPIENLANALIETKNVEYIYKFAYSVSNAPTERLIDAIIDIGSAEYIYHCARSIKNAPIEKLADALIKTKELIYIDLFMHIDNAPLDKMKMMKDRIIVGSMTDQEKLQNLLTLAENNDLETISYSSDLYRMLFIDDTMENKKNKTLVRKKDNI